MLFTLSGVSLLVALLAAEATLARLGIFGPPSDPIRANRPDRYQADPSVGYRLRPSRTMSYRYPANGPLITLVSNSDGLRSDRELDERDARTRILVVGNSFVFGEGVSEDERLMEVLEELEPDWRVDNLGMPGWGLDLMVRALERYGRKSDPDVVVLALYTDDFRRLLRYYAGQGFAYRKFELAGSELRTVPYRYPAQWERFRIVQGIYRLSWTRSCRRGVGFRDQNRYDMHEALLGRYLKTVRDLKANATIVCISGRQDTCQDQMRRGFLQSWATEHEVPYLDLTQAIHGAAVGTVCIKNNFHWNAAGHRIAAEQLRKLLLDPV